MEILGDLQVPLLIELPGLGETLGDAVVTLGGMPRTEPSPQTPLTWLGNGAPTTALQVTFGDWRGGVFVAYEGERPTDVELTLQDFDRLALANDSTSILT